MAAIAGNGWIAAGLTTGHSTATLGATIRPVDDLAAAGLGWLTGLVQPLQDTVDRMAGDSSAIRTYADAWQRTADNLLQTQNDLARSAAADTADWHGSAADRYREHATAVGSALRGTAVLAAGLASATGTAGEVLAGARQNAGDQLTDLVRRLISYASLATAVEGGVTTNVMAQASTMVDSSAGSINALEENVRQSIANVTSLINALAGQPDETTPQVATTRSVEPWQVAALGDPPMPNPVPDAASPTSVSALQLLAPDQAAATLPSYYSNDHSNFYDNLTPEQQHRLRDEVNAGAKHPPDWVGLSDPNAEAALRQGPPGTHPVVRTHPNLSTIMFKSNDSGVAMLFREVVDTDPAGQGSELRDAISNLTRGRTGDPRWPRDVFVQVPDGTTTGQLQDFLGRFGPVPDPTIKVFFRDTSGQPLGVGARESLR